MGRLVVGDQDQLGTVKGGPDLDLSYVPYYFGGVDPEFDRNRWGSRHWKRLHSGKEKEIDALLSSHTCYAKDSFHSRSRWKVPRFPEWLAGIHLLINMFFLHQMGQWVSPAISPGLHGTAQCVGRRQESSDRWTVLRYWEHLLGESTWDFIYKIIVTAFRAVIWGIDIVSSICFVVNWYCYRGWERDFAYYYHYF